MLSFRRTIMINEFECGLNYLITRVTLRLGFPQPKILAATSLADIISPEDCSCWLKGALTE